MTNISRREALAAGVGFATITMLPLSWAHADKALVDKAIADFTGGASVSEGNVSLDMPEIAENGNTVPLNVSVDSPMADDNYVESVMILASGNPTPGVATFHFTPLSGEAAATTRMRLASTQDVIAVAKTSKGEFFQAGTTVKVTIGGCGG
ncbi:MAG: thiosulfate oxidation carrier protein SoxY [Alphaproteobacteria bacterium TMED150]|nr:thiosulfate oxidation carrier protein SoxY [Paracoccaceae bacterium]RPH14536.1 MAG: thiosulfate oxidation carrier protein SoxY [Alphaproteobacteria bacterium TMED150]HCJ62076.1 thiosulfate oxidation carrier protein SoxY [Alphaproteobacteria bacterium]|tara:strand:- start:391 stop:843 length:453 start_codon:yes stop_codon:yes gene_type:complete